MSRNSRLAAPATRVAGMADGGSTPPRLNSALRVEIVPLRTEEDRQQFGMWLRNINRMLFEIILEMRGLSKGEIDELMGTGSIDRDWIGYPGAGDLAGLEFSEGISSQEFPIGGEG